MDEIACTIKKIDLILNHIATPHASPPSWKKPASVWSRLPPRFRGWSRLPPRFRGWSRLPSYFRPIHMKSRRFAPSHSPWAKLVVSTSNLSCHNVVREAEFAPQPDQAFWSQSWYRDGLAGALRPARCLPGPIVVCLPRRSKMVMHLFASLSSRNIFFKSSTTMRKIWYIHF